MTKATVSLHPLLRELESHLHSHKNSPAAPCPKIDMSITASYARLGRPLPGAPGTWSKDIQRYITKYRYPRYQSTSSDVKNLLKTTACDVPIYQIWVSKHLKIFKISRASCEISRASCEISRASCEILRASCFIRIKFTGQLRDFTGQLRNSRASCEFHGPVAKFTFFNLHNMLCNTFCEIGKGRWTKAKEAQLKEHLE